MGGHRGGPVAASPAQRTLLLTALVLSAAGITGCSAEPRPTPELSPVAPAVTAGPRVALPVTVEIVFHHPRPADRTAFEVLYAVQQALRAQLHAEYGPGAKDPLLAAYWSRDALAAARREVAAWVGHGQQPVGVLSVTQTSYSSPIADRPATVSFCADWSGVARGNATLHLVGPAVQKHGAFGTFNVMTVSQDADGRWRVAQLKQTSDSPDCPPPT